MQKTYSIPGLRERDWQKAAIIALSLLLAGTAAFSLSQTARLQAANARIDAVVQKAFYETCELTEGMSVNFRKLLVAGETGQAQMLLNETALQAQGAMSNLALLPLGQETVAATLKFINQAGDFAGALSVKLANGGMISTDDYETLETLSETAAGFSVGLARLLDRYERGEAVFDADDYEASGLESLYPITRPAGEYPVLLYDGPFSDGRADGEFKALEGRPVVSVQQAESALRAFIGTNQLEAIEWTGESSIPVDCYEFSLRVGGYDLSAGVTKAGGEVLYMLCDSPVGETAISRAEAEDIARAFLMARGYGEVELSYSSAFDGILTANFAAVQSGVVLYPDLVKVQVSMRDGTVIGLEAAGWLMNHVERAIGLPALAEQDALDRIGGALRPIEARLCVIPDNTSEALCWEVRATDGSGVFLAYIDAETGIERELMQVVADDGGDFVM